MRQRTTVFIGAATAGVLLLGAGAWQVLDSDERSPEDTVAAFFDARQRGDCESLLDLVSEASWSEDGRLDEDGFLEICAGIVEDYQPELHEVRVRWESEDETSVRLAVVADEETPSFGAPEARVEGIVVREYGDLDEIESETLAYEDGRLVREDGEWRVRLDQRGFGLGRSAEQTVWGYLEAYRAGDCEAFLDHLSQRAWSDGGRTDRAEFLESCSAEAEARKTVPAGEDHAMLSTAPPVYMPQTIEVSRGSDGATAEIPWASGARWETVRLVVEDLQWKVDTGTLEVFEYAELGTRLLGQPAKPTSKWSSAATPVYPGPESSAFDVPLDVYEGDDAVEQRRKAGFVRGLGIDAGPWDSSVKLLLYEFADAEGASAYAAQLSDRIVARSTEYNDVTPVLVPGVDGATAIVTECSGAAFRPRSAGGDCAHANKAATVAAHGRYVVGVEAVDFKGADPTAAAMRAQAITPLKAQLDRLDGVA